MLLNRLNGIEGLEAVIGTPKRGRSLDRNSPKHPQAKHRSDDGALNNQELPPRILPL